MTAGYPPSAKIAFLSDPEPKVCIINVQGEGENDPLHAYRLNRDQLFRLNKQTADILLKDFK